MNEPACTGKSWQPTGCAHKITNRSPKYCLYKPPVSLLTAKYPSLQPTKKLESWPEQTFADFLKEVKKQKIAWSPREEPEWLEHFTAARALRRETEKTRRATPGLLICA